MARRPTHTGAPDDADQWEARLETAPSVSVIIPVFNSLPELRECLSTVLAELERIGGGEVIAVDNGSTDGSPEYVASLGRPEVRVLRDAEASVGLLRNLGAQAARGELLSFLDSDCIVVPGYYEALVRTLGAGGVDATGSKVRIPEVNTWVERVWYDLHVTRENGPAPYINSGNFAVRRLAFETVGGFRTDLASGEDSELGQRLVKGGYRIVSERSIGAVHLGESKTLRSFFRRQTWHGVGMFATLRGGIDKPVLMLGVHVLALLAVIPVLLMSSPVWVRGPVVITLIFLVPTVTVGYRYLRGGGGGRPVREILLYTLYYSARLRALGIWAWRRIRSGGGGGELPSTVQRLTKAFRNHRK